MNFDLKKSKFKPVGDTKIKYGLNARGSERKVTTNVFGDGDSDSDDDEDMSGRDQTNRQIAAEQAALRKRAEAAAAAVQDSSIYDYDGAYDSFQNKDAKAKKPEERKSRYVGDLLKAAKDREQERDVVYERKMARDQEKEEKELGLQGKDKFVTKAYKRKLEERKRWEADEEKRRKVEEENDVTKKSTGDAFTSFYGNLSNNVALGGLGPKEEKQTAQSEDKKPSIPPMSFLDGFEKPGIDSDSKPADGTSDSTDNADGRSGLIDQEKTRNKMPKNEKLTREIRERKVAEARIRYLERMENKKRNS